MEIDKRIKHETGKKKESASMRNNIDMEIKVTL
jgi:hypothetical protein